MSIAVRAINGREHLIVCRTIAGQEHTKTWDIEGLVGKELALLKHEAKKLDEEWALMQGEHSFFGPFWDGIGFYPIQLVELADKSGFALELKDEPGSPSTVLPISGGGLSKSFNTLLTKLLARHGFRKSSVHVQILKDLWLTTLQHEYREREKTRDQARKTHQQRLAIVLEEIERCGLSVADVVTHLQSNPHKKSPTGGLSCSKRAS